jgi:acetylornithine/succinyldiaminopimelate/putrescine aminotransferase
VILAPPLVISSEETEELFRRLDHALNRMERWLELEGE